jgi:hypothetical protein
MQSAKTEQSVTGKTIIWTLWECEKGNRWISANLKGFEENYSAEPCCFSGCSADHRVIEVGKTTDRDVACDWFRNVNRTSDGITCNKCGGFVPGHASGAADICTCDPISTAS